MAVKETIGDGSGRQYANSQFSDQDRQDAISRGSAVSPREARGKSTDGLADVKHTVTSTVQVAQEWQQQLRLPTTPSGDTCMTACALHKSQKASSRDAYKWCAGIRKPRSA